MRLDDTEVADGQYQSLDPAQENAEIGYCPKNGIKGIILFTPFYIVCSLE